MSEIISFRLSSFLESSRNEIKESDLSSYLEIFNSKSLPGPWLETRPRSITRSITLGSIKSIEFFAECLMTDL